jgi:hypothetical protein
VNARACSKPNCHEEAVGTLSFDYREAVAVFGPLSPEPAPPSLDLCARHYAELVIPHGWRLIVHAAFRQ